MTRYLQVAITAQSVSLCDCVTQRLVQEDSSRPKSNHDLKSKQRKPDELQWTVINLCYTNARVEYLLAPNDRGRRYCTWLDSNRHPSRETPSSNDASMSHFACSIGCTNQSNWTGGGTVIHTLWTSMTDRKPFNEALLTFWWRANDVVSLVRLLIHRLRLVFLRETPFHEVQLSRTTSVPFLWRKLMVFYFSYQGSAKCHKKSPLRRFT